MAKTRGVAVKRVISKIELDDEGYDEGGSRDEKEKKIGQLSESIIFFCVDSKEKLTQPRSLNTVGRMKLKMGSFKKIISTLPSSKHNLSHISIDIEIYIYI